MTEPEFLKRIIRDDHFFNDGIQFENGYVISIQASRTHYCKPKENLADISQYDAFEVACFSPAGEFFVPEKYADRFSGEIAGYISSETVEGIYQHLKSL